MIKPKYIDPRVYEDLTCEQIRQEQATYTASLKASGGLQATSVFSVIASVVALGGPPDISHGWHGTTIASLKGRLIALEEVAKSKGCEPQKDVRK